MRDRLIADVPMEPVGVWLSHNTGFDMSTLPPRFSVRELNERIIAANASPVGFVGLLIEQYGQDGEITRDEFMRDGLHAAAGYATTQAGTAGQIADYLEEIFEATDSRGGFMLGHSQCGPRTSCRISTTYCCPSCSDADGSAPPIPAGPCARTMRADRPQQMNLTCVRQKPGSRSGRAPVKTIRLGQRGYRRTGRVSAVDERQQLLGRSWRRS